MRQSAGTGEGSLSGPEYADPWAVALQSTNGRMAVRSDRGGGDTAGFTTWRGVRWSGVAGPFQAWMLTRRSSHLWRADLPADLAPGVHTLEVSTTDRYGRTFRATSTSSRWWTASRRWAETADPDAERTPRQQRCHAARTEPLSARHAGRAALDHYPAGSASANSRALWEFISFQAWGRLCGASQCSRVAS